jgi:hypothetical protein
VNPDSGMHKRNKNKYKKQVDNPAKSPYNDHR